MKLSGAPACVIDEGRHKRSAGLPQQAGLPEHLDAAKEAWASYSLPFETY